MGEYPPNWDEIATRIKDLAGWKCERCDMPHGPCPCILTVHHLDGDKSNCEDWNLAALCQRCHLIVQARVKFYQDYALEHTPWMLKHVLAYNEWAKARGRPLLTANQLLPTFHDWEVFV